MIDHELIKALVRTILEEPHSHQWTVQGFGMLRTYFDADHTYRLNVWSEGFRVPNVSLIHNHPWDFSSLIVAGILANYRYTEQSYLSIGAERCMRQTILTGEGGGLLGNPEEVWLRPKPVETYAEGMVYSQKANEVHKSMPVDGTVTLNRRVFRNEESHALVYWPYGEEWVTAEPRRAHLREVHLITRMALEKWFS